MAGLDFINPDVTNIDGQIISFKFDISRQAEQLLNAKDVLLQFQRDVIEKYKAESILLEEMIDCGGDIIDRIGEAEYVGEIVIQDDEMSQRVYEHEVVRERVIKEGRMRERAIEAEEVSEIDIKLLEATIVDIEAREGDELGSEKQNITIDLTLDDDDDGSPRSRMPPGGDDDDGSPRSRMTPGSADDNRRSERGMTPGSEDNRGRWDRPMTPGSEDSHKRWERPMTPGREDHHKRRKRQNTPGRADDHRRWNRQRIPGRAEEHKHCKRQRAPGGESDYRPLKRQKTLPSDSRWSAKKGWAAGAMKREGAARTITKVVVHGGIYVCGTGGLLARRMGGKNLIYHTNTSDDVSDMSICECNQSERIVATTSADVLICNALGGGPVHAVHVPGLRRVEAKGSRLFIVLCDGSVRIFEMADGGVENVQISGRDDVLDFFPTPRFPDEALLTLKESQHLYRASRADNYEPGAVVAGVCEVRGVLGGLGDRCICYSAERVWLIGEDFEVQDSVVFHAGIKLVSSLADQLIVVADRDNRVYTFKRVDDRWSDYHRRVFTEDITAVAVSLWQVYVAIRGQVLTYDHMLTEAREPWAKMAVDAGVAELVALEDDHRRLQRRPSPSDSGSCSKAVLPVDAKEARRTITRVLIKKGIYVCGTGGLLARLTGGAHFIYETNTSDNVSNMMICGCNKVERLIVSTEAVVLIYDSRQAAPLDVLPLPGVRKLHYNGSQLYIVLNDGSLKILSFADHSIKDVEVRGRDDIQDFFPTLLFPIKALLTLKTSRLLYHASRAGDYAPGNAVSGVKGVREFIGGLNGKSVCFSGHRMWLLDNDFEVDDRAVFRCGIKCVSHSANRKVVVVDRDNRVHTYNCTTDSQLSCLDIRAFEDDITAVAIDDKQVFVVVDNRLLSYDYTAAQVQGLRAAMMLD